MKTWKSILFILLVSLIGWGGYALYSKFNSSRTINSLDLISGDAVFTFETNQADQVWNELVNQPVWNLINQFPAFQSFSSQLTTLDSLLGSKGFISKTLRNKQVTVSYHASGSESFNLLFTINFGTSSPKPILQELKSKVPAGSKLQSRKYSNQEIFEYVDTSNIRQWTITVINNVLLLSSSSFVIEEAIRFSINDDKNQLADKLGNNLAYDSEFGRLIITSKGLGKLLGGVSVTRESPKLDEFNLSDHVLTLDLTFEENKLLFKGPAYLDFNANFLPSIQSNFTDFEKLISNRAQSITQINLDGIFETQKLINPSFSQISTLSGEIQSRLLDKGFMDYLSGEMYSFELEEFDSKITNKALLIKSTQPEQVWSLLKEFRGDTEDQSIDYYRENEILFFPEVDFPAHLFKGKFSGFEETHISLVGKILVMTNSARGMKLVLDDYSLGNTWSGNPRESSSNPISSTSGYSKTFMIPKIIKSWIQKSNPNWSTFLQKFENEFNGFPIVAFKLNQFPQGLEGSLVFQYVLDSDLKKKEKKSFELVSGKQINLSNRISYGPKIVKNFNDNTEDIIVQDENNILHLINSAGEEVYSLPLSGPILSETFQIDFYKNGKLQILLATSDQLYAIDRLGNSLPGFPISLPGEKISQINLVDYDRKKEYRYFISTEKGDLWLFDKTGNPLEGWKPLSLGEKTIGAPFHIRIPGKGDFMIAQTKSGKIYFFNRRGEKQPGSPLELGNSLVSPFSISHATPNSLTVVSHGGEVITGSYSGEISSRKQMVKTNRDDRFELLSDHKQEGFIILLRQFNKTLVVNEKEETIISLPISSQEAFFNYYDFGNQRKILAVTDPEQGFGYLYDFSGNLLTNAPLESEGEIEISHQTDLGQFIIFTRSGKRILEYVIPD